MDVLTHTLIAVGCIAAAFYAGRYFTIFTLSEKMLSTVLYTLERDCFIKTVTDSDGEVEDDPESDGKTDSEGLPEEAELIENGHDESAAA